MSTLSDAYAYTPGPATIQQAVADSFKESPAQESILRLRIANPDAFDRLGSTTRMAAAMYEQQKHAWQAEQDQGNE